MYDCANVTKQHCTTLWTTNEEGERVWAGTDDDCREVETCLSSHRSKNSFVLKVISEEC